MQCYRSQGNKKEYLLLLPFGACVSSLFCLSWKLEILNTLTHKCIKINEVFLVPRELEGTSVQLSFSPNNDELGNDKEGGARDRMLRQRTHSLIRNKRREALLFLSPLTPQVLRCQSKFLWQLLLFRTEDGISRISGKVLKWTCVPFFSLLKKYTHL